MITTEIFVLLYLFTSIDVSGWWVAFFLISDWSTWDNFKKAMNERKQ